MPLLLSDFIVGNLPSWIAAITALAVLVVALWRRLELQVHRLHVGPAPARSLPFEENAEKPFSAKEGGREAGKFTVRAWHPHQCEDNESDFGEPASRRHPK